MKKGMDLDIGIIGQLNDNVFIGLLLQNILTIISL
jgi:hypothetical protein